MNHRYVWPALGLLVTLFAFRTSVDSLADTDEFHVEPDRPRADGIRFHVEPYLQLPTPEGMTIMWETTVALPGVVEYGPTRELGWVAIEERPSTRLHQVRLDGLSPGSACYYRVRSGPLASQIKRFRTAPIPGASKWRMALYGDSRSNPVVHRKVVEQIAKHDVDLILHTGDIVLDGKNYNLWRLEFFAPIAPIAGRVPWVSTIGNHERDSDNYFSYAALPGNERYFSFDFANAHIVGLDSNSWPQGGRNPKQLEWLEADLKSPRDPTWTFVYFHHPLFSAHRDRGINSLRWDWAPLFLDPACGVDAVLTGHDHFYARNYRMARLADEPQPGVLFMTSAGGGASLYPLRQRDYVAQCRSVHHFTLFDFEGDQVTISAIDILGRTFDRYVLQKEPTPAEEFCAYDIEELREFFRKALNAAPAAELSSVGVTALNSVLEVPTRFAVPVRGVLRWSPTLGWELPIEEVPFELAPRQPLRISLQASVSPVGLGKSPKLTIEFAPGRFCNRTVEVFPFKLTGPAGVAAAPTSVVRLDGQPSDDVWKNTGFLPLLGQVEREPSRVQLASDGSQLYVFATLANAHGAPKVASLGTAKTPSKLVLNGEHVRVEIADGANVHTFAFSPEQIQYHAVGDKETPSKWLGAAAARPGGWFAELAVPLTQFSDPKRLRINVVHHAKGPSRGLLSLASYLDFELRPTFGLGSHPDLIPDWKPSRSPERFARLVLP